jgi:hypothetical protein
MNSRERTLGACWFRRSAETNFCLGSLICGDCKISGKVREGETPSPARYKRALPGRLLRRPPVRLLPMPRLGDVLNARLAFVTHQHEGQSVCVWPAELIHARASAIFGDRPFPASLLNCNGVAGKRIGAPDLCFWLCSCNVKRSIGIYGPDRAQRVGPLAGERSGAGARDGFASSHHYC